LGRNERSNYLREKYTHMNQIPILFLGDSPSASGGLSRIGRDIATLVSEMDEFHVGFLGRGGFPTQQLPFMQYTFPESDQWGEGWLQPIWNDFAKGVPGILFTIWDPSRLTWLGEPVAMPNEAWLRNPPFQKWGYFPIDHEGPGGKLSIFEAASFNSYNRILAYGMYGARVLSTTINHSKIVDWLPHGLNLTTFQPRDKAAVRTGLRLDQDTTLIGCVMTNQYRKNWSLAFDIISMLKPKVYKLKVWCKTDSIDRYWDFRSLAAGFHVDDVVMVDLDDLSDLEMSHMYSACDITMLPSLGEGFGYPLVESLACGVSCIHGNYAGGVELLPEGLPPVEPIAWRYDTRFNCKRPVFKAEDWVEAILHGLRPAEECRAAVEHLDWSKLGMMWQKWFREGLR
jgi:glycosyltransferase involved in cell wall biosynthesis